MRITLLLLLVCFLAPVFADESIIMRFSHINPANSPKGKAAERLKQLVEKYSQGRIKVEVYADAKLYKDIEEIEAIQLGNVEMLAPSLSKFGPLGLRDFELFDLPFLFKDRDAAFKVMDGETGIKLFNKLKPKGVIGLAYWDLGFKSISANKAVKLPTDLSNIAMRIQPSLVLAAQVESWGGIPVPLAFGKIPEALRSGTVAATENVLTNFIVHKIDELQSHLTLSEHGYLGYAVIINRDFWENLPEDLRKIIAQSMKEVTEYERNEANTLNHAALEQLKQAGKIQIYHLNQEERNQWRKHLQAVHSKFPQLTKLLTK